VGLEPETSKTSTVNVLTTAAIGAVRHRCITMPSLCKVDNGFNDVTTGPLVFEIWSLAAGSLVTSLNKLSQDGKTDLERLRVQPHKFEPEPHWSFWIVSRLWRALHQECIPWLQEKLKQHLFIIWQFKWY